MDLPIGENLRLFNVSFTATTNYILGSSNKAFCDSFLDEIAVGWFGNLNLPRGSFY